MCWRKTPISHKKLFGSITSKSSKVLIGNCSICNRKKSMTVSDDTIKAEGLGGFFKNLGKKGLLVSKMMARNVLSNPGRALDLTAKIATAAASQIPNRLYQRYQS